MTVEYEEEKTEVMGGDVFVVNDYVGGNQLPALTLELLDGLKQGPASSASEILAMLSTSEGFVVGNVSLPLKEQTVNFPRIVGFGLPGVYNMIIRFKDEGALGDSSNGANIDPLIITVHMRNCIIGEVTVGERKICSSCSSSTYNFRPEAEECRPCPDDGNCTTRAIIPNAGFWHASPCSVNIMRCLTSYACKFENRLETLANLTRSTKSCTINATTIEEYQQRQCTKVSDWSLIRSPGL